MQLSVSFQQVAGGCGVGDGMFRQECKDLGWVLGTSDADMDIHTLELGGGGESGEPWRRDV